MRSARRALLVAAAAAASVAGAGGCGGGGATTARPPDGDGGHEDAGVDREPPAGNDAGGAGGDDGGTTGPLGCPDLFDQSKLRTYSFEISPSEWASLDAEFHNLAALQSGVDFTTYHPVTLRLDDEKVTDAAVKLHGQSSWLLAASMDGERAKMQFTVSFDEVDPSANFHGMSKLVFDMPRSDWTFMHDRLAHAWLRKVGIMASCAASARLMINGQYYGLFVVEESVGHRLVKQYFPDTPDGDLWKGGELPQTNQNSPRWDRKHAFEDATTLDAVTAIVDVPGSLPAWAAEAILNNGDGYYGGEHNFYVYDQGPKGFVFVPQDTDSTFDWLALFSHHPYDDHPVYWWEMRTEWPLILPGPHWSTVLRDANWRKKYAQAMASLLDRWDESELDGWIDDWSAQIAGAVEDDPHTWARPADFRRAVAAARDVVHERAKYLRKFVDCELGSGSAEDADGDGVPWCGDCRDDSASVHPGAREVCGNGVDDDCDGVPEDGCPAPPMPPVPPNPPPADAGVAPPPPAVPDSGTRG